MTCVLEQCESDTGDKLHKANYAAQEIKNLLGDPAVEAETQASGQKQQPGIHHHKVTGLCLKQQQL